MTQVPVDRDVLEKFLKDTWDLFLLVAEQSDFYDQDLEADSPLVTLSVQAGLPLPGPMAPGQVPPAPPPWLGRLTAATYRDPTDGRLRCLDCGKVVYGAKGAADAAAARITEHRQGMRAYLGECGHYHLARNTPTRSGRKTLSLKS